MSETDLNKFNRTKVPATGVNTDESNPLADSKGRFRLVTKLVNDNAVTYLNFSSCNTKLQTKRDEYEAANPTDEDAPSGAVPTTPIGTYDETEVYK